MITLLKELLFVLVQRGTKTMKRTTNIFGIWKNQIKICLWKILKSDRTIAVDPSELEFFFSNIYKENDSHSSSFLEDLKEVLP